MNSRQLQYAVMLSEFRSFSQVAEKLNISQPALSKHIISLENELGIKLFDRTTIPMSVTPAGQYFLQKAQELLYKEDQLIRSLERYKSGEAGQLTIGITPFRSSYLIPSVIKEFRTSFPHIQVKLQEAGSDILRRDAAEGKFDFAVVNLPVDESMLDIIPLESDRLVLVVPQEWRNKLPVLDNCPEIDFSLCKDLHFVVVQKNQEMRRLFDKLCSENNFSPIIAAEVVSLTTAWSMARAGVAATILPLQFIEYNTLDDSVTVMHIKNTLHTRQPVVITRKGQYISAPAKHAIDLLIRASHQQ